VVQEQQIKVMLVEVIVLVLVLVVLVVVELVLLEQVKDHLHQIQEEMVELVWLLQ
jgi:hypothetical protein